MSRNSTRIVTLSVLAFAVLASGCTQVRGRKKVQEAGQLYRDGRYKEAVVLFEEAQTLIPDFPKLWLNKGVTCRQMVVPGSETAENKAAAKCATEAFARFMTLAPGDARGENLYVQTLFDTNQFDVLSKMFEERFNKNPRDMDAIMGLIQTYTKANKLEEALQWYMKKAEIQANDPEAQYAVGVYLYQQLAQRGGGPDKQAYIPPGAAELKPGAVQMPTPGFAVGDIVSMQRIDMAELGIKYLVKATEMRPKYHEAMTYLGLIHRQKSFAQFTAPADWRKSVDEAEKWRRASLEAQGKPVTAPTKPEGAEEAAASASAATAGPAAMANGKGKLNKGKVKAGKVKKTRVAKRGGKK